MAYIKIETGEKRSAADILRAHPSISFPNGPWRDEMLADLGYAELHQPAEHPFPSQFERLVEGPPQLIDGKWTATYTVESIVPGSPDLLEAFIAEQKAALNRQVTQIRYQREVQGLTLSDGTAIRTDRESQATLTGAYVFSQLHPAVPVDWKGASGWVQLTAEQIAQMAAAVGQHVQALFSAERAHYEAIESLTSLQAVAGYDVFARWPEVTR